MKKCLFLIMFVLGVINVQAQTIQVLTYGVSDGVWNDAGKFIQVERSGTTVFETGIMFTKPPFFEQSVQIEAVVFLETVNGDTDISDTLKFTDVDFVGSGSDQKPIECSIPAPLLENSSTNYLKVKYRYYRNNYPDEENGWSDMIVAPGDRNYSILKVRYTPLPATTFEGPNQICDEGIYTITNPGTISLDNASGVATLTELGNNQWKITRIGSGEGNVVLRSTVETDVYSYPIVVSSELDGTVAGSTTIKLGWSNKIITFTPADGKTYANYDWEVYHTTGPITTVENGNSITVSVPRNYRLNDLVNGDYLDFVLRADGECGVMEKTVKVHLLPTNPLNPPPIPPGG